MIAKEYGVTFSGDENVLKWTIIMVAYIIDHTKKHWIVHFKWMNCIVCKLYCNQVV